MIIDSSQSHRQILDRYGKVQHGALKLRLLRTVYVKSFLASTRIGTHHLSKFVFLPKDLLKWRQQPRVDLTDDEFCNQDALLNLLNDRTS
jgi:hypothetical protein